MCAVIFTVVMIFIKKNLIRRNSNEVFYILVNDLNSELKMGAEIGTTHHQEVSCHLPPNQPT